MKRKNKKVTLEAVLPLFHGYYDSIFDVSDSWYEQEVEHLTEEEGVTLEEAQEELDTVANYPAARLATSQVIADAFETLFNDTYGTGIKVKFLELDSPRYYNFTTDRIICSITFDVRKIRKLIVEHIHAFKHVLEREFTSYDGFRSHYSNDVEDWDLNNIKNWDVNEVWALFEALCWEEDLTAYSLFSECDNKLDEGFSEAVYTPL